jgi:putative glycosyltransferase (TIGR04372 family)
MPWAILATVIIRILRPWILIRVGIFKSHRIGHFITDAHYQIVLTKIGEVDSIDLWATGAISNQSYNRIIKRNLYVSKYFEHIYYWNHIIPGGKVNQVNTLRNSRDTSGIFTKHLTHINFSDDESAIGLSWLMDFGWKQGEPFICLLNRDQKYLNDQIKSSKLGILPKNFYDYHSYRNSSIIEYQKSILWMIEKGYWIIRMGKAAEQKLLINHRQLIDYPFLDTQSDLLDLWIFSNCSACISTGTGIDCLSWIQGIPSLALNYLPLMNAVTAYNVITVPKNLFWLDNHKELNLKEYLKHGYL